MADPFSIGALIIGGIGLGSSALGAVTQAEGAKFTAEAQANQANYKAQVAKINERISKQNADYARYSGELEAQKSGLASRYQQGQITVAQGASNLDLAFGSPQQVRDSAKMVARHDQTMIRSNAARKAYAHELEGMSASQEGKLYSAAATNARIAGDLGYTSSILGGISSVSSKWLQGQQVGLWG